MKQVITLLLLSLGFSLFAQDTTQTDWRTYKRAPSKFIELTPKDTIRQFPMIPTGPGTVTIKQDERIKDLAERYNRMKHVQKGYRVQIYLGSRDGQGQARSKFQSLFPNYRSYLDYQAPNFKVRVGDFKDRMDAERLLMELRKDFPGAYIVPDEVELDQLP